MIALLVAPLVTGLGAIAVTLPLALLLIRNSRKRGLPVWDLHSSSGLVVPALLFGALLGLVVALIGLFG